ncbi:uncharacterized protein DS421_15g507460 [Arachis hypogaea]|nr:uncharacterized protein DS421_15g507460 [Arachis hypogaea]
MQPPSRCRSSICPATTAIASAPPRCVLLQHHPNTSVPSRVRASTQPQFRHCSASHLPLYIPPFSHLHRV